MRVSYALVTRGHKDNATTWRNLGHARCTATGPLRSGHNIVYKGRGVNYRKLHYGAGWNLNLLARAHSQSISFLAACCTPSKEPKIRMAAPIVSATHSFRGRPRLRTYCSVAGHKEPGMKDTILSGWPSGHLSTLPSCCKRPFSSNTSALTCRACCKTAAFVIRDMKDGLMPRTLRMHLF